MNRSLAPLIFFVLPALTLACAASDSPQARPSEALAPLAAERSPEASAAATSWRWIGVKDGLESPACPDATGWTAEPLFAQEDPAPIPRGLRRFCLYESSEGEGDPARLRNLVRRRELSAVAPDHMAVGTSANELKAAVWEELRDHFLAQAGAVALSAGPGPLPRLAFADTGPTNDADPENGWDDTSAHGYTLANLAKDLLCGPAGCLARITSRLALPHTNLGPVRHPVHGGYIGTVGEVAVAIRREVHAWETAAAGDRLILNLSLGWDGTLFGGGQANVNDMPLDVQAVYKAIENAVCRGALVIAAAGNRGGGPDPEIGPLHPAAWERRPAPSYRTCARALRGTGAPNRKLWPAKYWPLVYAAGGVDAASAALANARPRSEPGLAAFADHAVTDDNRSAPTAVLTGSSGSAAVVSAAAAAVWHYRPRKKPHEVMELVYGGGVDLGRDAQLCVGVTRGQPCQRAVHRVSVCAAVVEACKAGGGACPASLPACVSAGALDLSAADLSAFLASPHTDVDLDDASLSSQVPQCGGETLHYSVRPPDPCPHRQHPGLTVELWSYSQPGTNPCSACWMDTDEPEGIAAGSTATLYVEIDPDFEGSLTAATLIVGSDTYSLAPASPLAAGERAVVESVPVPVDLTTPILLSFTLNDARSVLSPVLVGN